MTIIKWYMSMVKTTNDLVVDDDTPGEVALPYRSDVQPRHVREARRLLSESIIAVESRDLKLDEDDGFDDVDGLGPVLPEGWLDGRGGGGGRDHWSTTFSLRSTRRCVYLL